MRTPTVFVLPALPKDGFLTSPIKTVTSAEKCLSDCLSVASRSALRTGIAHSARGDVPDWIASGAETPGSVNHICRNDRIIDRAMQCYIDLDLWLIELAQKNNIVFYLQFFEEIDRLGRIK